MNDGNLPSNLPASPSSNPSAGAEHVQHTIDSLDVSLHSIGGLEWPGRARNQRIEEFLMQQSSNQSVTRGRLGLWLGVGALLVSGAVYGSVRLYQSYMVHLTVNGQEQVHEVEAGPDGTAMVEVPIEGGGTARILVGPDNVGADGTIHAGIEVHSSSGASGEKTVKIESTGPADANKNSQPKKDDSQKDGPGK